MLGYLICEAAEERMASFPPNSDQTSSLASHLMSCLVQLFHHNDGKSSSRLTLKPFKGKSHYLRRHKMKNVTMSSRSLFPRMAESLFLTPGTRRTAVSFSFVFLRAAGIP